MSLHTADLCDDHSGEVQIAEPVFHDYGGVLAFHGPIETIHTFEDNSKVRELVGQPGNGRVLVVDGGGSKRCALLGDNLAAMAVENGWAGVVINGCIRDSHLIAEMPLGVKALATHPLKSVKRDLGDVGAPVRFAGVTFQPGHTLYADLDGIIVSEKSLG